MAIEIKVPNFTEPIIVKGMAEEETLRELLEITQQEFGRRKKAGSEADKAVKAQKANTKAVEDSTSSMSDLYRQTSKAARTTKESADLNKKVEDEKYNVIKKKVIPNLLNFGGDLVKVSTAIATSYITSYSSLNNNTVSKSSELLATAIDVGHAAINKTADMAGGVISIFNDGMGEVVKTVVKGASDVVTSVLQSANAVMADRTQLVINEFFEISKMGASFSNSIDDFKSLSATAGLTMEEFSAVVKSSTDDLHRLGMTSSDGTAFLAKGLKMFGIGTSAASKELLALGWTTSEQTDMLAKYMLMEKTTGRSRYLTEAQVQKGMKEYAVNLKVLSDITGKDARAKLEEARQEWMVAKQAGQLTGDQLENFTSLQTLFENAGAGSIGKELSAMVLANKSGFTGTAEVKYAGVIGPELAELSKTLQRLLDQTPGGNTTVAMAEAIKRFQESYKQNPEAAKLATMRASVAGMGNVGISSDLLELSTVMNKLELGKANQDKKAADVANDQLKASGEMTSGIVSITDSNRKLQQAMEDLVTGSMGEYVSVLDASNKLVVNNVTTLVKEMSDIATQLRSGKSLGEITSDKAEKTTSNIWSSVTGAVSRFFSEVGKNVSHTQSPVSTAMLMAANSYVGKPLEFAKGGISTGDVAGYQATLHGTEAVVPLPDNRSIPVKLDSGSLEMAVSSQGQILSKILSQMEQLNTTTKELRNNSM